MVATPGDSFLPGYYTAKDSTGVEQSHRKLSDAADSFREWISTCSRRPCTAEEETWAYRCRCSFQLLRAGKNGEKVLQYAVRKNYQPISIQIFPIASLRIQRAMRELLACLNEPQTTMLSQHVTSVTFSSSWSENPNADCVVTLHYEQAILDEGLWQEQAAAVCSDLALLQLTARSRKRVVHALVSADSILRDTIWITRCDQAFNVGLNEPLQETNLPAILVHYQKPSEAFFHPNAVAMRHALEWMLGRLATITEQMGSPARLLEMYCGCGAHTVALARSGLLVKIVAIELDKRLVQACKVNCERNTAEATFVEIVSQDAAIWARRCPDEYDILLVDPPRQGLDEQVCNMAVQGSFQHFLYISCGREALGRDLELLSPTFEVIDCTLLDLFPRTDAVETLVHLQRRPIRLS